MNFLLLSGVYGIGAVNKKWWNHLEHKEHKAHQMAMSISHPTTAVPLDREEFDAEAIALTPAEGGPFAPGGDTDAYKAWRDAKLERFPARVDELVVEVRNPAQPSDAEAQAIRDRVARANMCLYAGPALAGVDASKDLVRALGAHFAMMRLDQNPYADEDAITPIHVAAGEERKEQGRKLYIPYTNRPINWHTDGYYNPPARRIRGMILHCVRQAAGKGGENAVFDPEMAYLLMREHDEAMIHALCALDAMTIPENDMDADVERGDVTGPVFSLNRSDRTLYMRYTARKRNIVWAGDADTERAVAFLQEILNGEGAGAPYMFTHRMEPGQGLICNNVLHTRTAFEDGETGAGRMMLRARYLDRVDQAPET